MTRMTRPDCAVMCNLINIHTYIHTYIHAYIHTYIHTDIHIYMHIYIHTCIHTYIHTNIHTYIHACIHTYIHKRKKPQNSCRRRAGNGRYTGGMGKKCRKERLGSVAANPDKLESNKEAEWGAQGTQGSSKNCTSRESVSPLSRLIRGFRNKYH